MQKQIFIALGAVLVVSALLFGWKNMGNQALAPTGDTLAPNSPSNSGQSTDTEASIKDRAWTTFSNYIKFAQAHDLAGIKSLSHQISDTCLDSQKIKECETLMDSAYLYGKDMKQPDLTNVWFDANQIILFSDFKEQDFSTTTSGYNRGILYFTRDTGGNPKLLSFNPDDGIIIMRKDMTDAEVDTQFKTLTQDSDQDGAVDETENCIGRKESECTKTNPNKKDSDKDGWWDGIEIFFKK